jgi:hypothetical protein
MQDRTFDLCLGDLPQEVPLERKEAPRLIFRNFKSIKYAMMEMATERSTRCVSLVT